MGYFLVNPEKCDYCLLLKNQCYYDTLKCLTNEATPHAMIKNNEIYPVLCITGDKCGIK